MDIELSEDQRNAVKRMHNGCSYIGYSEVAASTLCDVFRSDCVYMCMHN